MNEVLRVVILIAALLGAGVGAYAGITVVTLMRRRFEARWNPAALPADELEVMHSRLGTVDRLEARVCELEERLDFTERLLAQQHQPEALSAAPRTGQH